MSSNELRDSAERSPENILQEIDAGIGTGAWWRNLLLAPELKQASIDFLDGLGDEYSIEDAWTASWRCVGMGAIEDRRDKGEIYNITFIVEDLHSRQYLIYITEDQVVKDHECTWETIWNIYARLGNTQDEYTFTSKADPDTGTILSASFTANNQVNSSTDIAGAAQDTLKSLVAQVEAFEVQNTTACLKDSVNRKENQIMGPEDGLGVSWES